MIRIRKTVARYRASRRLGRETRRKARHSEVPALDSYARRATYYRQNRAERLTPAQRRRVRHKENAGRRA